MSSTDFTLDSSLRGITDDENLYDFKPQARSSPVRLDKQGNEVFQAWLNEYRTTVSSLEQEISRYQIDHKELKFQVVQLIDENQRLSDELRASVQAQLSPARNENQYKYELDAIKQQLSATNDAKDSALQMWNMALQEVERLQRVVQKCQKGTDLSLLEAKAAEIHNEYSKALEQIQAEAQKSKMDFLKSHDEAQSLKKTLETILSDNNMLNLKMKEQADACMKQSSELHKLRTGQLIKETEIIQLQQKLQSQEKELQTLASSKENLEKSFKDIQSENNHLSEREEESIKRARESIRLAEEALLEKDAAVFKQKQAEQEISALQKTLDHLAETAARTTKEAVDLTKRRSKEDVNRLTAEVKALEMENIERQCLLDRFRRENQTLQEECVRLKDDWKKSEGGGEHFQSLCQKLSNSEQQREIIKLRVDTLTAKLKDTEQSLVDEGEALGSECERLRRSLSDCQSRLEVALRDNRTLQQQREEFKALAQSQQAQDTRTQAHLKRQMSLLERRLDDHSLEHQRHLQAESNSHNALLQEMTTLLEAQQTLANKWKSEAEKLAIRCEEELRVSKNKVSDLKNQKAEINSFLTLAEEKATKMEEDLKLSLVEKDRLKKRLELYEQLYQARLSS